MKNKNNELPVTRAELEDDLALVGAYACELERMLDGMFLAELVSEARGAVTDFHPAKLHRLSKLVSQRR